MLLEGGATVRCGPQAFLSRGGAELRLPGLLPEHAVPPRSRTLLVRRPTRHRVRRDPRQGLQARLRSVHLQTFPFQWISARYARFLFAWHPCEIKTLTWKKKLLKFYPTSHSNFQVIPLIFKAWKTVPQTLGRVRVLAVCRCSKLHEFAANVNGITRKFNYKIFKAIFIQHNSIFPQNYYMLF